MPNSSHNDPKFTDEPEGLLARATEDADDTEGHKLHPGITDDGTIPNAPENLGAGLTDEDDDTEGHLRQLMS